MARTIFQDGDPANNVLGTIVDAAFLNLVFNHQHDGVNNDGHAPILLDNIATVNAAYAVGATDMVLLADATAAGFTITMPDVTNLPQGRKYLIKKTDNSPNFITLAAFGAQTFDTMTTIVLAAQNDMVVLMSGGAGWFVVSNFSAPVQRIVVAAPTTSVSFAGLSIVAARGYRLEGKMLIGGSACDCSLLLNNDLTATDYYREIWTPAGVAQANDAKIWTGLATAEIAFKMDIERTPSGVLCANGKEFISTAGAVNLEFFAHKLSAVAVDLSQIEIITTVANMILAGSEFRLYKRP